MEPIYQKPMDIEARSMAIIEEHLTGVTLPEPERSILKRRFRLHGKSVLFGKCRVVCTGSTAKGSTHCDGYQYGTFRHQ